METYTFLINTLFLRKVKYQSKFFQNNLSKVKGFKPIKFNPNLQVFTIKTPFLTKETQEFYFDFQDETFENLKKDDEEFNKQVLELVSLFPKYLKKGGNFYLKYFFSDNVLIESIAKIFEEIIIEETVEMNFYRLISFKNYSGKPYKEQKKENQKLKLIKEINLLNLKNDINQVLKHNKINFQKLSQICSRRYKLLTQNLKTNVYNITQVSDFFTMTQLYQQKLLHLNSNSNSNLDRFEVFYEELENKKIERDLKEKLNKQRFKEVDMFTNIFNKSIAKYVSSLDYLPYPVSNGFVKMWEILNTFNFNFGKDIKSFHFAEMPGQMMLSLLYYCKINNKTLDWVAESLNPNSPVVKKEFGRNFFKNDYGFMKLNPKRWYFGNKKTGNLLDTDELKSFRKYNLSRKLNFISSDAGTGITNLETQQKLEIAQTVAVLGSISDGTNVVVKHFTPYDPEFPESKYATKLFLSHMNLYYQHFKEVYLVKPLTSKAKSGEFYVVGMGGKQLTDKEFDKLCEKLDNFKTNEPIEKVKNKYFVGQIFRFLEEITKLNLRNIELINFIYDHYDEFSNNRDEIEELLEKQYEEWVKRYHFSGEKVKNFTKGFF